MTKQATTYFAGTSFQLAPRSATACRLESLLIETSRRMNRVSVVVNFRNGFIPTKNATNTLDQIFFVSSENSHFSSPLTTIGSIEGRALSGISGQLTHFGVIVRRRANFLKQPPITAKPGRAFGSSAREKRAQGTPAEHQCLLHPL